MPGTGKSIETESRLVVWQLPGLGVEKGAGSDCLMTTGFPSGVMEMFWNWTERWLHNTGNVPNATELFTLK